MHRRFRIIPAVLAMVALALVVWAGGAGRAGAAETQVLEIATRKGVHSFEVEMATNDADRARGLMFRKSLPPRHGMLFDFDRDLVVTMWMRNTYVSLDMIFIRRDGTIARIARNTVPLSERVISSGEPVRAVLEVVAGTSRRLGIAPGDRVAHPIFNR